MRVDSFFICPAGSGFASGGLEQEGHVIGQGAQDLHPFLIQCRLAGFAAVDNVPVLRCHDGHVHHLERHVQGIEGSGGAAPSADCDGSGRLACNGSAVGVEGPLDDAQNGSVGLAGGEVLPAAVCAPRGLPAVSLPAGAGDCGDALSCWWQVCAGVRNN